MYLELRFISQAQNYKTKHSETEERNKEREKTLEFTLQLSYETNKNELFKQFNIYVIFLFLVFPFCISITAIHNYILFVILCFECILVPFIFARLFSLTLPHGDECECAFP